MCLAVPGKIITIDESQASLRMARVSFGGMIQSVCLDLLPEAEAGNYVLVHAGFALNLIDETEAEATIRFIMQVDT